MFVSLLRCEAGDPNAPSGGLTVGAITNVGGSGAGGISGMTEPALKQAPGLQPAFAATHAAIWARLLNPSLLSVFRT